MKRITHKAVWLLMSEGCNANEIAAYWRIKPNVATTWMVASARKFADRKP